MGTEDSVDQDRADEPVTKAVGEELRLARMSVGWTRPELVKRMNRRMPVNTLACYEQGIRQCPIPRLAEICQALGTSAPDLLRRALQRVGLDDASEELRLLREIRDLISKRRSASRRPPDPPIG